MPMYEKLPVRVEAMQLTSTNVAEVYAWVYGPRSAVDLARWEDYKEDYTETVRAQGMLIVTLEDGADGRAKHVASIGDYIIKGVKGEFYPCKPDIFTATYRYVGEL